VLQHIPTTRYQYVASRLSRISDHDIFFPLNYLYIEIQDENLGVLLGPSPTVLSNVAHEFLAAPCCIHAAGFSVLPSRPAEYLARFARGCLLQVMEQAAAAVG
jgi:hypothetical protein